MNNYSDEYYYLQVHVRQGEMAVGRSIAANIFGQPSLIRCTFEALDEEDGTCANREEFLIYAGRGQSLENLSGTDRSEAESALQRMHRGMIAHGCERIANGPHWYSYRYRVRTEVAESW